MPYVELGLCPLCLGSLRQVALGKHAGVAGQISPCGCGSGVEMITEDGEVIPIAPGILEHGQAQEKTYPPS